MFLDNWNIQTALWLKRYLFLKGKLFSTEVSWMKYFFEDNLTFKAKPYKTSVG